MVELRREKIPENDYSPWDAGWDARVDHKRKMDNPYAINNWKHYDWEKGWQKADEQSSSDTAH
jgi:hypothetical protein